MCVPLWTRCRSKARMSPRRLVPELLRWRMREPSCRQQFRVNAHHRNFLVVRAVEHANLPPCRQRQPMPPQPGVAEFLAHRWLEARHRDALRVDAFENRANGPILAGSVHSLEDQQEGGAAVGEQSFLMPRYASSLARQPLARLADVGDPMPGRSRGQVHGGIGCQTVLRCVPPRRRGCWRHGPALAHRAVSRFVATGHRIQANSRIARPLMRPSSSAVVASLMSSMG